MQIMQYSVWIVGALVAAWGVAVAIKPQWMKRVMDFFVVGRRFWLGAAAKVAIGIIFLVFARECREPGIIIAIGVIIVVSNLFVLTLEPEKVHRMMAYFQKQPPWIYRTWGVVAALFGGLLLYAG
jgi:mannose/fructose/N-acetylgalactosamine-specific phosphotransferase system component IIC